MYSCYTFVFPVYTHTRATATAFGKVGVSTSCGVVVDADQITSMQTMRSNNSAIEAQRPGSSPSRAMDRRWFRGRRHSQSSHLWENRCWLKNNVGLCKRGPTLGEHHSTAHSPRLRGLIKGSSRRAAHENRFWSRSEMRHISRTVT